MAAVIGHAMPYDLWATVAEVDEGILLAAIDAAAAAHLALESRDGTGAAFTHALIREAIYQGVRPSQRRRWHRIVGEVLMALPHPDPDAVAHHLQQAGDERAPDWLVRAGERAQASYAWVTAAQRFDAALALMERQEASASVRGWLLFRLARLRRFVATSQSLQHIDAALALAREAGDEVLATKALVTRGMLLVYAGRAREGVRELDKAVEALEMLSLADRERLADGGTGSDAATIPGVWMLQAAGSGQLSAVVARADCWAGVTEPPRVAGQEDSAYGDGWAGLSIAYALTGQVPEAEDAIARALAVFEGIGHHHLVGGQSMNMLMLVVLPYRADHVRERQWWAEQAAAAYHRASGASRIPPGIAFALLNVLEGRWDGESIAALESVPDLPQPGRWAGPLARLYRERGERERAWERIQRVLPDGAGTEPGGTAFFGAIALIGVAADLSLDVGDVAAAQGWLAAHDRWLAWSGTVLGQSEGQALWARYHRQTGDTAQADQHAQRALARATEPHQPLALLAAQRLLGELETEAGRYEYAARHLDAALALADACAAPYERALTLLAQAELHAATGDTETGRVALDKARTILERLGARPALVRADTLSSRLATSVPSRPAGYPAGLTDREVEVLRLVAAGLANADIAARLSVSVRTVETHISAIYGKLGTSSRTAATRFAFEHGLT
jgi:DNA-binding CsgD family transcriptional regulator/tetratricopeptide (TPR) repeat protein